MMMVLGVVACAERASNQPEGAPQQQAQAIEVVRGALPYPVLIASHAGGQPLQLDVVNVDATVLPCCTFADALGVVAYLPQVDLALLYGPAESVVAVSLDNGSVVERFGTGAPEAVTGVGARVVVASGERVRFLDARAGALQEAVAVTWPAMAVTSITATAFSPDLVMVSRSDGVTLELWQVDAASASVTRVASWSGPGMVSAWPHVATGTVLVSRWADGPTYVERYSAAGILQDAREGRVVGALPRTQFPDFPDAPFAVVDAERAVRLWRPWVDAEPGELLGHVDDAWGRGVVVSAHAVSVAGMVEDPNRVETRSTVTGQVVLSVDVMELAGLAGAVFAPDILYLSDDGAGVVARRAWYQGAGMVSDGLLYLHGGAALYLATFQDVGTGRAAVAVDPPGSTAQGGANHALMFVDDDERVIVGPRVAFRGAAVYAPGWSR